MNNLLIDIGNSDIKAASARAGGLQVKLLKRISYSKINFEKEFDSIINVLKFSGPEKIGISVLNNLNKKFLTGYFKKRFNVTPIFAGRDSQSKIKINYSESLGNDRICSAVAAQCIFNKRNFLVIDFGTATTYTFVSDKTLLGGLISPGIKTSLNSLIENTKLPDVKLIFPKNLINNETTKNIQSGVLNQSLYSAERVIKEIAADYRNLFVIATGGYCGLIAGKTKLIDCVDRNLVLKGINFIISG